MKDLSDFIRNLVSKYFTGSFFLVLPQGIAFLVSLATLPVILANLSMEDYGTFQFVLTIQLWINSLTGHHITLGAKRGIARGLEGTFIFAFFARLKILIVVGLVCIIASLYIYWIGLTTLALLLTIVGLFIIFGHLPHVSYTEFFIAKKQFSDFALWQSVTLISIPVISTLVAFLSHNILFFCITQFFLMSLIGWLGIFYVVKKNRLFRAFKKNKIDRSSVSYGIKLIPAGLISETSNKITDFIIGPFFGFANLAIFSIASRLEVKSVNILKTLHNLLYSDFAKNDQRKLAGILRARIKYGIVISIIITLFFVSLGYLYIKLYLPENYQDAIIFFLILSLGLPAVFLQIIMQTILAANFRYKELTILTALPSVIKIILLIILGLLFGIIGICLGVALGDWIRCAFYYFFTVEKERITIVVDNHPILSKLANKIKNY